MIIVEIHGGTYVGGRHVQGAGFGKDREKCNMAQEMGYICLEYDTKHVKGNHAIEQVNRIVRSKAYSKSDPRRNLSCNADSTTQVVRVRKKRPKRERKTKQLD